MPKLKSWPTHKIFCQQVTKKTNEPSDQLKCLFEYKEISRLQGMGTVYYWGNVPATDLINLPLNEGCDYSKPLLLLVCGVGDPRNVLLSLFQLPEDYQEELTFVLNDICACTLARTVLILCLLFTGIRFFITYIFVLKIFLSDSVEISDNRICD